jgi:large subunit ribosomal protein L32e
MAEKIIPKFQREFQRQDQHKKRLKKVWRKPRGRHSKVRLGKRGHQARVRIGYKVQTPKEIIIITQVSDLKKSDATLLVSGKVGKKRKSEIAREAIKQNITLKNLDAAAFIKEIEQKSEAQKKEKAAKEAEKKKVEAKAKEKKTELEKKVDGEEDKDAEKKDKDKLLTQRERK